MVGGFEIVFWTLLAIGAATDLIYGKIYNAITFPFLVVGVCAHFLLGDSSVLLQSVWSVVTAFLLLFPLYWLGALAAGDVKLLMALGAWTSQAVIIQMAVVSVVLGASVGLAVLISKRGLLVSLKSIGSHLPTTQAVPQESFKMPFAPAFLGGYLFIKIAEVYGWL